MSFIAQFLLLRQARVDMGCGSSMPEDLSTVDAGMATGIGPMSKGQMGLIIKQKFWSLSSDTFSIKDHTGQAVIGVKGNWTSLRDKMHITDVEGNKIAVMQRKILALRSTFYIFSYTPNFDGQESTEKDMDNVPLYRHAYVQDQFKSVLGRQIVKKFVSSNKEADAVGVYEIFSQFTFKFICKIKTYASPEQKSKGVKQQVIATAGQTSFFQLNDSTKIAVEMAAGCDIVLILLGMVAAEKIREGKEN